jgi:hypothetical protein
MQLTSYEERGSRIVTLKSRLHRKSYPYQDKHNGDYKKQGEMKPKMKGKALSGNEKELLKLRPDTPAPCEFYKTSGSREQTSKRA